MAGAVRQQAAAREKGPAPVDPAPELPVARVLVDVPLAHLDRPFDYTVPRKLDADVVAGSRVKVRFAGQDVDGFVLERVPSSEHPGRLAPLRRAVSGEPVLSRAVAALSEEVAARYAGTRSDVLRLAVPPRHATVEKQESVPASPVEVDPAEVAADWAPYDGGRFTGRLAAGESPHAVWAALPGEDWARLLALAAAATAASGRGALLCAPDRRDVDRLDAALTSVLGAGRHVVLAADAGPSARYRAFLAVARGAVRIVVGTRAAAFAPVHDLGLVAMWDDGDDLYAEPRAPYPHTREVLLTRGQLEGCAVLVGGFARTVEGEYLIRTGWAEELSADRRVLRARSPHVAITGATDRELERDPRARSARLPRAVFDAVRAGLEQGPVLLQTPRQGYVTSLACDRCRAPARCRACTGPLRILAPTDPPTCRWCGVSEPQWACPECGGRGLRAPVLGERRTAEELGRAFPAVPVRTSGGERVLAEVGAEPALVVATPGAEPVAAGGYSCVVLLDTWLMLARPDLRTGEESLRRWLNAVALGRPAGDGGRVLAVGEPSDPVLQALVRWDPVGFAQREMAERQSAHLPPASRLATVTGTEPDLESALASLRLPAGSEVLGPVPVTLPAGPVPPRAAGEPDLQRLVLRVPRAAGPALSRALVELNGVRSARKLTSLRVQVDPVGLE
ncbi:primosomal protein N' [Nocardioides mesophilus]|uniref:Probable replication restart protein PriA n=1 Tax=Nocardioides mesophilus TaxID=433659 RepID=A0A7G9RHT9_9ACTN|nr:primosomal protein N' [Nocardioides mesophilus]